MQHQNEKLNNEPENSIQKEGIVTMELSRVTLALNQLRLSSTKHKHTQNMLLYQHGGKIAHADQSNRTMLNKNNNHNDEANYEEQQKSNQEYDIEYDVDTSMHDEQKRSLPLDGHGDREYYGAAGMEVRGATNDMNNIQSC